MAGPQPKGSAQVAPMWLPHTRFECDPPVVNLRVFSCADRRHAGAATKLARCGQGILDSEIRVKE